MGIRKGRDLAVPPFHLLYPYEPLDNTCLFQHRVRAVLGDGLDSFGGEGKGDSLLQLRHINALLLEVRVLPYHPCRVELGSTSAVGVTSTHNRAFSIDWTYLSHSCDILAL
jgi:hypothetical protein